MAPATRTGGKRKAAASDPPPAKKPRSKAPAAKKASTATKAAAAKKVPAVKVTAATKKAPATTKAATTTKATAAKKAPGAKKTTATSITTVEATVESTAGPSRKRKSSEEDEERPVKKSRAAPAKRVAKKTKNAINDVPREVLNVYVFGEGSSGELGLGSAKNAIDVKRPRLNPLLSAESVGVVQISAGGMHVAALTYDNQILTWGVNDQGALGRDTTWDGGLKDIDDNKSDSDSDDGSDSGLNPKECTPTAIPSASFPEGTEFVEVAAGDSITFALTTEGQVYGWGTFRHNEGILGFSEGSHVQTTPVLIPQLKKIKKIVCGANHALALDQKGGVFAWGSGQQHQLGRRIVQRTCMNGLVPREFGLPKGKMNHIKYIACGAYHSFAIDTKGQVWSWGLNNYAETGIVDGAGEDGAMVPVAYKVAGLAGDEIICLKGGAHHSIAVTAVGECLVWGRLDGGQMGIDVSSLDPEDVVNDSRGNPRILLTPTAVPLKGKAVSASAGPDHCICIMDDGRAWSWGFSANYQTGLGTEEDVDIATPIENTAVRGKKLIWAGCGGQYSILTAVAEDQSILPDIGGA
ncbi:hypothetical protein MMC12_001907 [Toensbergia leucococca]|nr:hypothetical protein [Toensbergia leucococca]